MRRIDRSLVAFSVLAAGLVGNASAAEGDAAAPATVESPAVSLSALTSRYNVDEELGLLQGTSFFAAPAARTSLMGLFDRLGVGQTLDDAHIRINGYVEGSYTWNANNPVNDLNLGRVFDVEHDEPTLNQLSLNIERVANLSRTDWDIGFRMQWIYGGDARFIHANGIFDYWEPSANESGITDGPENQYDPVQFYVDVNVPIGNGLRVRAGRFLFFKQIDPSASVFYSHSFTFGAALPFTLTGVTGFYPIDDKLDIEAGVVRGWGQSLEDNNGGVTFVGRARYQFSDKTSGSLSAITGPEQDNDNEHYRTAIDLVLAHQLSDQFTLLFDAIYGYQAGTPGVGAADWYGLSVYGVYRINDNVSAGARLEYYRDDEGFTFGLSDVEGLGFKSQGLYEVTLGLTLTPFAADELGRNLKIRPEVRYDYSDERFFDGFTRHDQLTFAIDAYFMF